MTRAKTDARLDADDSLTTDRDAVLPDPERPHPDDIRRQLDRIVNSSPFRDAHRLTSFLSFIVETTLMGNGKKLKAYTIAVEALGRGTDFDPQIDPIVRVEAVRLRHALARYYSGSGRDDPLVIEVPRGGYVPAFRRGNAGEEQKPRATAALSSLSTAETEQSADIARRRRELSQLVKRFRDLIKAYRRQVAAMAAAVGQTRRMLVHSRVLLEACERLDLACGPDRPLLPTAQPQQSNDTGPADGRKAQRQQTQSSAAARLRRPRARLRLPPRGG